MNWISVLLTHEDGRQFKPSFTPSFLVIPHGKGCAECVPNGLLLLEFGREVLPFRRQIYPKQFLFVTSRARMPGNRDDKSGHGN